MSTSKLADSQSYPSADLNSSLLSDDRPSNHPWHLHYNIQHDLLTYLQRELENMCQRFGQEHFPGEMQAHKWTDPGSMELTSWIKFIRRKDIASIPGPFKRTEQSILNQMLSAVADIRHSAVHRVSKDVHFLSHCVWSARMFAELHCDTDMADAISHLSKTCQVIFDEGCSEQQRTSADLKKRLAEETRKLEQKAIEELERKRDDWRAHAGHDLSRFLSEIASRYSSAAEEGKQPSEDSTSQELEGVLGSACSNFVESVIAKEPSAEPGYTAFPQQGSWQLQRHNTAMNFICTRCNNSRQSTFVAYHIAKRHMPLCNKCYAQLLAGL
jgi:hypothetical protein